MIEIKGQHQFKNAAERVKKERLLVQIGGFRRYFVTNKKSGRKYEVVFSILDGKKFGTCTCEAGTPMKGDRQPMVCKHLYASLGLHIALMSQQAPNGAPLASFIGYHAASRTNH